MSAAQERPRRTSARVNDTNDDDGPPAKKAKTDKTRAPPAKATNGRKGGVAASDFNQSEDGFTFRKKTRKPDAAPPPLPAEQPPNEHEQSQPVAKEIVQRGRPRKSAAPEDTAKPSQPEPQRRSKRLSAEKTQQDLPDAGKPARSEQRQHVRTPEPEDAPPARGRKRASKDGADGNEITVKKKRQPTKIALPFADTPVIERNKELRKTSSESRRRSSSTMRGRRASTLMDNGNSNGPSDMCNEDDPTMRLMQDAALPHDSVDTADFYKHISTDMPEPRRMKQLMTWCGARAMPARPGAEASGSEIPAVLAARAIQDELLADIANKDEMSDWHGRPEAVRPVVLVKKPNPRNTANAEKLKELEAEVDRLEHEKASWDSLLSDLTTSVTAAASSTDASHGIDESLLSEDDRAHLALLPSASTTAARQRFTSATSRLEFNIDTFASGAHKLSQLERALNGATDTVMAAANKALEERARKTGDGAGNVGDLLRAFSRAGGAG